MTNSKDTGLSTAERCLLMRFLDELSDHQSNAGCNDIELENTTENVALMREVLAHPDYAGDPPWEPPNPRRPSHPRAKSFYAPCGDHGLLGHLRRKLEASS